MNGSQQVQSLLARDNSTPAYLTLKSQWEKLQSDTNERYAFMQVIIDNIQKEEKIAELQEELEKKE